MLTFVLLELPLGKASLLTATAHTAEVSVLKQDLERSENKLGHAKRQLEEKEGK